MSKCRAKDNNDGDISCFLQRIDLSINWIALNCYNNNQVNGCKLDRN